MIHLILTKSNNQKVILKRELYGYGRYFIADNQEKLQKEFRKAGANIVRELFDIDYHNKEFLVEDIDSRWIVFLIKDR